MATWPVFFFRVREIRPAPGSGTWDGAGRWHPPTQLGDNVVHPTTNSNLFFACNGTQLGPTDYNTFMNFAGSTPQHHHTVSLYHSLGELDVIEYDATRFAVGAAGGGHYEPWRRLCFLWRQDGSSFATSIGDRQRLQGQRVNQAWARCLLPDGFQARPIQNVTDRTVGGMNGSLPLLIALVALSYPPNVNFPNAFQNGQWLPSQRQCEDRRGVVVETYIWPNKNNGTETRLQQFEQGQRGKIFA